MNGGPFHRPAVLLLLGGVALSLACWLLLIVFGDRISESPTTEPSAYSRSAIGHRAFVELLRERGVPVVVSRHDSSARAGDRGLLVLAEPLGDGAADLRFSAARRALLVLPKRSGEPSRQDPDWIARSSLVSRERVEAVLTAAGLPGTLVRPGGAPGWAPGRLSLEPTIGEPQLVEAPGLEVISGAAEGALFGVVRTHGRIRYILSDPDLIANHGLGKGSNAEIALRFVEEARAGGTVYVDETCHGFASEPSIFAELFRPPLLYALAQAAVAAGLLLWSGARRFGAPAPRPPPLSPGKSYLIENTAALLRFGGHAHHAVDRYYRNAVQEAARHLNPPPGLDAAETERWLLGSAEGRGLLSRTREMEAGLERVRRSGRRRPLFVLGAARRIHRWKQEMVHGPRHDS